MEPAADFGPPKTQPDPTAPGDDTTLSGAIARFTDDGFAAQFIAAPNASVECANCRSVVPAPRLEVIRTHRFEGASDPADMMCLFGVKCPVCAAMGTLLLAYGVNADNVDADVATSLLVPSDAVDVVDPDG